MLLEKRRENSNYGNMCISAQGHSADSQEAPEDSSKTDQKIIFMYAKGRTTRQIERHQRCSYQMERIRMLPVAKEWQQRPLESIYAVVFLDAIHYHVRSEGQIVKKAVYIAIGVNLDGRKDVLGMWV